MVPELFDIFSKVFKVLSFSLFMKWWVLYLWLILLFIIGLVVFKVYPASTGKIIFWQNSDFNDPANPNPSLSPIPIDSPLTDIPSVTVNCAEAKDIRDSACKAYSDKYSEGCKWYHLAFSFAFDCKDLRTSCSDAQDKVTGECR